MPRYSMTWVASTRRWKKMHRGKMFVVSCRQLDAAETKEASWRAANAWWEEQRKRVDESGEDEYVARTHQVSRLVADFSKLDDDARREVVEALLGAGSFDRLRAHSGAVSAGVRAASPERTMAAQVEAWKGQLRAACESNQMSEGRYDAYCRRIRPFASFVAVIDAISEATLDDFHAHLSARMLAGGCSAATAHELMMTAKQFVRWLAERRLIALPGNIESRRLRFSQTAASRIETFTIDEVRAILSACDGFSERTKLYLLLMLNCGMYQNDISELKSEEVDWKTGVVTRARSKTRERGGPVVSYKLWPETFDLLTKHRAKGGELALTTDEGNQLVRYWLEEGKMRRYDAVQSAWSRLAKRMGASKLRLGMKHLRKTSASILAQHPRLKFYANHYLADSPKSVADRHHVVPSDAEFFKALNWLGGQVLGPKSG